MKDLVNLAIYGGGTLAVILLLIFGADVDAISSNAIAIFAILSVIVAPVAIGVFMAKKEKREEKDDA